MVSQSKLISKGYHSLVPGLITVFRDGMGPFKHTQTGACPGFLKGGSNISWFPKKRSSDFKRGVLVLDGSPPHYFISAAGILSFRMDTPKFPRFDVTAYLLVGRAPKWTKSLPVFRCDC